MVPRTSSWILSQLFRCLLLHYQRRLTSLVPVLCVSFFPFNFCLCVSSLFTSLPVGLGFSFPQLFFSFCYCFEYTKFYTINFLCSHCGIFKLCVFLSVLSFFRQSLRGHMLNISLVFSFGHYKKALYLLSETLSLKEPKHFKMSCYCTRVMYCLLLKFRCISLVVIILLVIL